MTLPPPLRVVYVLGRGVFGGIERHVQALVRHLDRAEFEPSVIVLFEPGPIVDQLRGDGVNVRVLHGAHGWSPPLARDLRLEIAARTPCVVHSHEMHTCVGSAMKGLRAVPWVHTEHCAIQSAPSPWKSKLLWRMYARRIDRILAVSEATAKSLGAAAGLPHNRIGVVHNGVDVAAMPPKDSAFLRRELGLDPESRIIGSAGRLVRGKGWGDFLEMAGRLIAPDPSFHCVVAGGGPEMWALQERVCCLNLARRVHFLGQRDDIPRVIGGMDVFVLASEYEEMPTTMLEAFAMRTPVVGFLPRGGTGEVLALADGLCARLLDWRDPEALAAAVREVLMKNEGGYYAGPARRVVQNHFDIARITRQLEDIYRNAAGRAAAPEQAPVEQSP
ncbi:glycosyltransferase [Candidatus Poribacteria bacterium]|nr:glycosyltransferase [Candidatus Poribacteria bacterium]